MDGMIEEFATGIVASVRRKEKSLGADRAKISQSSIVEQSLRTIKTDLKRLGSDLTTSEEEGIRRRVKQLLGS